VDFAERIEPGRDFAFAGRHLWLQKKLIATQPKATKEDRFHEN
jgi:hypothetical protein